MFDTLLVANRGEIARRIIRTARAMGIRTVAVYSETDEASDHVRDADVAVALGGRSPAESYLDVSKLVAAASRTGAGAVHPGYGFVSERADAAQAFLDAGVVWVGPPPSVIDSLGDKIRAKQLMAAAGVPLLPGCTLASDASGWAAAADDVGYPLLVKAAAGGGGRGMRVVAAPGDLHAAIESATREAASAFGDGTVFLERYLGAPRHIEVQVMADTHGSVIHLGERECSIQRRHQKVIEEAPAAGLGDAVRDGLRTAAVAGARAVGYVGAGTWEFLVDGDQFAFLEVNTRLQVEHPVTELVTGLDLVRLQLEVAAGQPLPLVQADVRIAGHAIEARVVAEDPAADWLPSIGPLHRFGAGPAAGASVRGSSPFRGPSAGVFSAGAPAVEAVRYDLGFSSGANISADYDSLLGKVIAYAADRSEAAARLRAALIALEIHGLATDRELLVAVLAEPDFLAGRTTTAYLANHPAVASPTVAGDLTAAHLVAATLWAAAARRGAARVLAGMPSGWRNLRSQDSSAVWTCGAADVEVRYRVSGREFEAAVDGRPGTGTILAVDADGIDLEIDGMRWACRCEQVGSSVWVASATGQTTLVEVPRFVDPSAAAASGRGPTAPVPGTVIAVEVAAGQTVAAGDTLVVLEAMKLEHKIRAVVAATVAEVKVAVGDKVDAHQLLVVLEARS